MANVQRTIRAYPELRERKDAIQAQSVTAAYSSEPRGGSAGRSTEQAALRGLAPAEEAALNAVDLALAEADLKGPEIRKFVQMHYWQGATMEHTAYWLNVSRQTVIYWNRMLTRRVASLLGLYRKL